MYTFYYSQCKETENNTAFLYSQAMDEPPHPWFVAYLPKY